MCSLAISVLSTSSGSGLLSCSCLGLLLLGSLVLISLPLRIPAILCRVGLLHILKLFGKLDGDRMDGWPGFFNTRESIRDGHALLTQDSTVLHLILRLI